MASMLLVPSLKQSGKSHDEPQARDFKLVASSSFLLLNHHSLSLKSFHRHSPPTRAGPREALTLFAW